jgi:hypothetical protein
MGDSGSTSKAYIDRLRVESVNALLETVAALADRVSVASNLDDVDHVYVIEDVLWHLDVIAGRIPPRGQKVDFP